MLLALVKEVSKRLLQLSFVFIGLSIIHFYPLAEGAEWEFLSEEDNEKIIFYNKERTTYPTSDTARVWIWYNDSMNLYEIRCSTKKLQVNHIIKYDSKGNVLWSHSFNLEKWYVITPDSIEGKLHKIVCSQKGKNNFC